MLRVAGYGLRGARCGAQRAWRTAYDLSIAEFRFRILDWQRIAQGAWRIACVTDGRITNLEWGIRKSEVGSRKKEERIDIHFN